MILGVEPVISLHLDHGRAQLARLAHQGAGNAIAETIDESVHHVGVINASGR